MSSGMCGTKLTSRFNASSLTGVITLSSSKSLKLSFKIKMTS